MAKQKGIIKIEGTVGDITFLKTRDGYLVKEKTSIPAARIATDPAFQRTRENMSEFGRAGKAGKVLRKAVRSLLQISSDPRVVSRLTKEMMKVIQADTASTRGQRNVIDGETEMLQGFDCNIDGKLSSTLFAQFTATVNRVAGTMAINLPSFVPADGVAAPAGTTHFKISALGAEVDFENETHTSDLQESAMLPLNNAATAVLNLAPTVTANSTHPLFLLLGIQFFQEVNGVQYPLKNGAFNALNIVKVEGV
jgi:hypothetical protein